MPIKKRKPVTPGQRGIVDVVTPYLYKGKGYKPLLQPKSKTSGRNNYGRITVRHKGGGHKQHYRLIDFKRNKIGVIGKVERIEYDPNRTSHIALICYIDGERRYILSPKGLEVGMEVISDNNASIKIGNSLPIEFIPVGTVIHCIEMRPGKGAQLARSAGASVQLLGRDGIYAQLRLRSGEIRKVHIACRATIGEVGNADYNLRQYGKAGAKRWLGIRPTVRGVAMNPIDHPHGGGEGKTASARPPVSPWGVQCKGFKTRNNKRTNNMIIRDRRSK